MCQSLLERRVSPIGAKCRLRRSAKIEVAPSTERPKRATQQGSMA